MERRRWRIQDFADRTGLSRASVERHVYGKIEPSLDQREKYAAALGMDFNDFERGWQQERPASDLATQPPGIREDGKLAIRVPRFRMIAPAAKSEYRLQVQDGFTEVAAGPGERFTGVVDGDCMSPKYRDGDTVLFELREGTEAIQNGKDYHVTFGDAQVTFKRLLLDQHDRNRVTLHCINPDKSLYPDRAVRRSDIRSVAQAVSIWRKPEDA